MEILEIPDLKRIKTIRKHLNWTQAELAKRSDISQSMINKIENGKKEPSYQTAKKIIIVLNNALKNQAINGKKAHSISTKNVIFLKPEESVKEAIKKLSNNFDQLPIIDKSDRCIGTVTSKLIMNIIEQINVKSKYVKEVMGPPLPQIGEDTPLTNIKKVLEVFDAVLTVKMGIITGIITRSDLIKGLEN
ncbi:MAG: CBS domain-containing protein [Promethearchaeota archaeon]